MRVALYHHLPPGGALRVVREFARHRDADVVCDLFTLAFDGDAPHSDAEAHAMIAPYFDTAVVEHVRLGRMGTILGGRFALADRVQRIRAAERRLATRIDDGGYDAVLAHPCWLTQTPSILRDLRTPTVYYMHEVRRASFEPDYAPRPRPRPGSAYPRWLVGRTIESILRRRDRLAATAPARLLCNSAYSRMAIELSYGRSAEVALPGVDVDLFRPGPAGDARAGVLSVGGLERFKGHHRVIEAVGRIPVDRRPTVGLVYQRCDDSYRAELLALARRLVVEVIEHRGVSDLELSNLYRSAAVTVLAADLEPFGLVPLESAASGTPVVAWDQAGYRETVLPNRNGILVAPTVQALADGLDAVMTGAFRVRAEDVRETVLEGFTWARAYHEQMRVLREAAGCA